jgi:hypothetical protein
MECYDPATGLWMFMSEMEKARSGLVLATIDQNIFAFGGRYRHTDQYYDLVERFVIIDEIDICAVLYINRYHYIIWHFEGFFEPTYRKP